MTYEEIWGNPQWPWSDLVSLTKRYIPDLKGKKVLELGCGTGANRKFYLREDAEYKGIETTDQRENWCIVGDFTQKLPGSDYDLIVDRSSMTHNDTESIKRGLHLAYEALKPGGLYIGVDWFSTSHSEYTKAPHDILDGWTNTNYTKGQFKGVGNVHFSNAKHLQDLFKAFKILLLEEKTVKPLIPGDSERRATWNIVAIKS